MIVRTWTCQALAAQAEAYHAHLIGTVFASLQPIRGHRGAYLLQRAVLDWAGRHQGYAEQLDRVAGEVAGIRRFGTASLDFAYLAAGRFEGFWEYGLMPWDMAAGIVLVREAGGLVTRLEGDADLLAPGTIVAGNPQVQPRLAQLLAR